MPVRKIAVYARVSTDDKGQDTAMQIASCTEWIKRMGHELYGVYEDYASADDYGRRKQWKQLKEDAAKKLFDDIMVWKIDRAYRSPLEGLRDGHKCKYWKTGFRSYMEPQSYLDPTATTEDPDREFMLGLTLGLAQREKATTTQRIKAGMEHKRKQGKHLGRPGILQGPDGEERKKKALQLIEEGSSVKKAASVSGIPRTTLTRLLNSTGGR